MILKEHKTEAMYSVASYSDCMKYRYHLVRDFSGIGPVVNFVMLNPSTATELANDPTVERCQRRAISMGFKTMIVTNIFALRSTDPNGLYSCEDPVGRDNDIILDDFSHKSDMIICAWGKHGEYMGRGAYVIDILNKFKHKLYYLKLTKNGHPSHPLYISYSVKPSKFLDTISI